MYIIELEIFVKSDTLNLLTCKQKKKEFENLKAANLLKKYTKNLNSILKFFLLSTQDLDQTHGMIITLGSSPHLMTDENQEVTSLTKWLEWDLKMGLIEC